MPTKLAGAVAFSVDGVNYDVVDTISYQSGGWRREELLSLSGAKGEFREVPFHGRISVNIRDHRGSSLADWQAMSDVTVIARLANGKTVSGSGLFVIDAVEINAADATFAVTFCGAEIIES